MNIVRQPTIIGDGITIKALRDYILDECLSDLDTILLYPSDFDELALDYFNTYKDSLMMPFLLLGVLIRPESEFVTRKGMVIVIEGDTFSLRRILEETPDPDRVIYRCGFCGTITDERGDRLFGDDFNDDVSYLDKFKSEATVKQTSCGSCKRLYDRVTSLGNITPTM